MVVELSKTLNQGEMHEGGAGERNKSQIKGKCSVSTNWFINNYSRVQLS